MGIERCSLSGGWRAGGKPCDFCKSAAVLFSRSDSAFLCLRCDTKIHGSNKLASRHERVWMCEVCEEAPAAVTCKADAASLCVACDADIHSANPLAHRHERVPVVPFFDSAESNIKSTDFNFLVPDHNGISEDGETAPWPPKIMEGPDLNFCEMDPFLAFESGCGIDTRFQQHHHGTESVVPVQAKPTPAPVINHVTHSCLDMDICRSNLTSFGYPTQTLSQNVSSLSVDARVVPDGNSMSDISNGLGKNIRSAPNQESQVSGMDREARVLRYREKRKNRKFEKTIRYASRKAYAESRPRIKGRFAKRTEIEAEVDECISSVPHLCPPQYFSAIWLNLTS